MEIMRVLPIAAESLGVRSMATLVTVGETRLLIDPGAAQGEKRFGLPPSPTERRAQARASAQIVDAANRTSAIFITHYHSEHYNLLADAPATTPVFAKVPTTPSQHEQSRRLFILIGAAGRRIALADGARFQIGEAAIQCSPPLSRGKDGDVLSEVMAVTVRAKGQTFVHASDLQGPLSEAARDYLVGQMPDLLYISGAPTYRLGAASQHEANRVTIEDVGRGVDYLLEIIRVSGCLVIVDHHLTRDVRYREHYRRVFATGRACTVAGFLSRPEDLLEARRPALHASHALETAPPVPAGALR